MIFRTHGTILVQSGGAKFGAKCDGSANGVTRGTTGNDERHRGRGAAGEIISGERSDAMIKKVKGGYKVLSETTGRNLGGPYKTKAEALKRLRQVEFFKRNKK